MRESRPSVPDFTSSRQPIATEVLRTFTDRFGAEWASGLCAKIGVDEPALATELIELMREHRLDHTGTFRSLSGILRGRAPLPVLDDWVDRWRPAVLAADADPEGVAAGLDRVNPVHIPRNHLVEEALDAATAGDMAPFERLLAVVSRPFDEDDDERYRLPADERFSATFQTFCGT